MKFSSSFTNSILILWICVACHNNRFAVVTGAIKNWNDEPILLFDDKISIMPDTIKVVNDSFYREIQIANPCFKIIVIGRYSRVIFIKPGYSLRIYGERTNLDSTIRFEGKGSLENAIQDSINNNVLYAVNYDYVYHQPAESALNYVDSLRKAVDDYSEDLTKNMELDKEYIEFLKLLLEYYFANLMMVIGLHNNIKEISYYDFISNIFVEEVRYLDIPEYRNFLRTYVLLKRRQSDSIADSLKTRNATDYLSKCLPIITVSFRNSAIREYLVYDALYRWLEDHGVKDFDKHYDYFKRNNKNKVYASQLEKTYLKKKLLAPGNYAPHFACYDYDGNMVSLSDFRGKYVYVDFWATWCKPCRNEIPHYVNLLKEYKDKDIVFLSISLDNDKERWQEFIKDEKNNGKWLFAGNGFDSDVARLYQISGIPIFFLIDREGKIINSSAPRPSSNEVRILLDSLLATK